MLSAQLITGMGDADSDGNERLHSAPSENGMMIHPLRFRSKRSIPNAL